MPLTFWGAREMIWAACGFVVLTILLTVIARTTGLNAIMWATLPLGIVLVWVFWFFRDPPRLAPSDPGLIVSPADGTVTHLDEVDEPDFIGGKAVRCSIFLSIFDVHLNRAPVSGKVVFMEFRKGDFFDARSEDSLTKNQNQDIGIITDEPEMPSKVMVRQSTGAIARNIVCPVELGRTLLRGERYGMIKFGSRTTLFLSPDAAIEWKVKIGDKVKAGATVLAQSQRAG